jgi:hypothetical protein
MLSRYYIQVPPLTDSTVDSPGDRYFEGLQVRLQDEMTATMVTGLSIETMD